MKFEESMLSAYLDGELSDEERHIVELQLKRDPAAQSLLGSLRDLRSRLLALPDEAFSSDPVAGVRKKIAEGHVFEKERVGGGVAVSSREEIDGRSAERRSLPRWLVPLSMAIAATLIGVVVYFPRAPFEVAGKVDSRVDGYLEENSRMPASAATQAPSPPAASGFAEGESEEAAKVSSDDRVQGGSELRASDPFNRMSKSAVPGAVTAGGGELPRDRAELAMDADWGMDADRAMGGQGALAPVASDSPAPAGSDADNEAVPGQPPMIELGAIQSQSVVEGDSSETPLQAGSARWQQDFVRLAEVLGPTLYIPWPADGEPRMLQAQESEAILEGALELVVVSPVDTQRAGDFCLQEQSRSAGLDSGGGSDFKAVIKARMLEQMAAGAVVVMEYRLDAEAFSGVVDRLVEVVQRGAIQNRIFGKDRPRSEESSERSIDPVGGGPRDLGRRLIVLVPPPLAAEAAPD